MAVYAQLRQFHVVPLWRHSLEKNRIPALMGNIVNNHFLINTWEIIFYKWMHLLECQYLASVHLADYLWVLLSLYGVSTNKAVKWKRKKSPQHPPKQFYFIILVLR